MAKLTFRRLPFSFRICWEWTLVSNSSSIGTDRFSFDLRDELSSMQADDLLELAVRREGYGPTYVPTPFSKTFLERFPKTTARYVRQIKFVADELGDKGVAELEKLATSFFIADREGIHQVGRRAQRLVDLKPHISLPEARSACEQVDRLIEKSRSLSLREESSAPTE